MQRSWTKLVGFWRTRFLRRALWLGTSARNVEKRLRTRSTPLFLEIYKQRGDTERQAQYLKGLAWLLYDDGQVDAAEKAAFREINLVPEKGNQSLVCRCHRILGTIYWSKGEREKAICHFETALGIASPFGWHEQLFLAHYSLAKLFLDEGRFDEVKSEVLRAVEIFAKLGATQILKRCKGRLREIDEEINNGKPLETVLRPVCIDLAVSAQGIKQ